MGTNHGPARKGSGARASTLVALLLALAGLPAHAAPGFTAAGRTAQARWSQGTYIWNSTALLDPQRREAELDALQQAGMQELLVGLSGPQVNAGSSTHRQLEELIRRAHRRGLRVELLLGDPQWILPAHRQELLALIQRYRQLGFDGLHLDLEVEQLGWPVPPQRLRDWIATVRAAARQSPWPLRISSHPRWFEQPAPPGPCLPCALSPQQQVSLMIYQRNPERAGARAVAIARRWPRLRFRLAQSVEPGLEPGLSWHGSSAGQLQTQVQRWRRELAPDGIGGIDWQDWAAYPRGR